MCAVAPSSSSRARGLVRLVKQLRAKKAEGDGRSFIDLVLDAASASQGNLAKVVAADQQGGLAYHAMQDEIASAKAETKELRLEMRRELSALRARGHRPAARHAGDGARRQLSKK